MLGFQSLSSFFQLLYVVSVQQYSTETQPAPTMASEGGTYAEQRRYATPHRTDRLSGTRARNWSGSGLRRNGSRIGSRGGRGFIYGSTQGGEPVFYNTRGALWKSKRTPSASRQISGQSAAEESSCMAQTVIPTDLADFMATSRSSNTVQSVGLTPRRLAASR